MRGSMAVIFGLCVLCAAVDAWADDASYRLSAPLLVQRSLPIAQVDYSSRPSSGTGWIVVGWIALGVGALNLASLPVCYADFYPEGAKDVCVYASIGIAAVAIPLGVTSLIVGYNQRSEYERWRRNNGFARHLERLRLAVRDDGMLLSYSGSL